MRFGLFTSMGAQTWSGVLDLWRHLEASRWDIACVTDHFMPNTKEREGAMLESWSTLSAVKSFKDANLLYAQKDWKRAAEKYEDVVARPDAIEKFPQLATAYFFLGNSYDQLYKPAKQGDAANDAYIQKAIANYRLAAEKNADVAWKK